MKYFQTIPKIATSDYTGNLVVLTNIMYRTEIVESLLKNPLLFYSYDIKDGDTPEIVASKYYNDPYRYWMVLFSNSIIDPSWDWPLNQSLFGDYVANKYLNDAAAYYNVSANTLDPYQVISYTKIVIHEYQKITTTTDEQTSNTTIKITPIDESTYYSLNTGTTTRTFSNGESVVQTIDKGEQTLYDYEVERNEAKRSIFLINSEYASQFELQLQKLMST